MKILVTKLEMRAGESFENKNWKSPMYIVNDEFLASSISDHNINEWVFDLKIGEEVDVIVNSDNWIARSTR